MLNWPDNGKIGSGFKRILEERIGCASDMARDALEYDESEWEDIASGIFPPLNKLFPDGELFRETCEEMLRCLDDTDKTYILTEYHWALIYHILESYVITDTDQINMLESNSRYLHLYTWFKREDSEMQDILLLEEEDGEPKEELEAWVDECCSGPKKGFEFIVNHYFWDTDFLMGDIDMPSPVKSAMGFGDGIFGVVNEMAVTRGDLVMVEG